MPGYNEHSDESWTPVARGKKNKSVPSSRYSDPPLKDYDIEQLTKAFEAASSKWQASSCRKETLRILAAKRPDHGWSISEALCLASGSFSRDNWQNRQRSLLQFAAFTDLVDFLRKETAQSTTDIIKVFVQDPRFTELDEKFLTGLGFEALPCQSATSDGPELGKAADHIKPTAFVFEPFLEVTERTLIALCQGSPALYVGSSLSSPIASKLEAWAAFKKTRGSYRFPLFDENPQAFEGLFIWWVEADDA